jgi:16S rRNA U516 pseudouridylate synthase RsuA-like enzyme
MMAGVEIDGVHVVPEEIGTLEDSLRLRIVVSEGKKHEVGRQRRMVLSGVSVRVCSWVKKQGVFLSLQYLLVCLCVCVCVW